VSQVFLAQLYGKGLLYHDQAHSPEAETERKKRSINGNSSCNDNCTEFSSIIISTLAIGYATGKQIQTSTRTNGATEAPIASP
jgi:hypothetical protein